MYKLPIKILLFLVSPFLLGQELAMVRENDRVGYINLQGEYAIQPDFENGRSFSDKFAAVEIDNLWGYIDNSGEWVIKPQFQKAKDFKSGYALVLKNNLWSYINHSGKVLDTPDSDKYYDFQDSGVAFIRKGDYVGLIDTTGRVVIKPQFLKIQPFIDGHAKVKGGFNKYGIINTKGDTIVPIEYSKLSDYHEKAMWAAKRGTYGIITGGIFKPVDGAKEIWDFTHGSDYAPAKRKNKVGFINTKGEWVIEPNFGAAKPFNKGFAPVRNGNKWGLINEQGKLVMRYHFDDMEPFSENELAAFKLEKKWGFINLRCNVVIPPNYQITPSLPVAFLNSLYPSVFAYGIARVKFEGRWGYLDEQGKVLGNKWYQNAEPFIKVQ